MCDVDIAGNEDDITPYSVNKTRELLIHELEKLSIDLFKWFDGNYMKTKSDKSQLLISGNKKLLILKISSSHLNIKKSFVVSLLTRSLNLRVTLTMRLLQNRLTEVGE